MAIDMALPRVSPLWWTRITVVAPFVVFLVGVLIHPAFLMVTVGLVVLLPFVCLLITCERCDQSVMESAYKADFWKAHYHLFFNPRLRCSKCGAALARR